MMYTETLFLWKRYMSNLWHVTICFIYYRLLDREIIILLQSIESTFTTTSQRWHVTLSSPIQTNEEYVNVSWQFVRLHVLQSQTWICWYNRYVIIQNILIKVLVTIWVVVPYIAWYLWSDTSQSYLKTSGFAFIAYMTFFLRCFYELFSIILDVNL